MPAKTAAESEADTSLLSRRIFSSPKPVKMVLPILAVSLLTAGVLAAPAASWDAFARYLLGVSLPVYGSAVLTVPVARGLGGHTYLRRTTLQAFVDALTVAAFAVFAALTAAGLSAVRGAPVDYDRARVLYLGFAASAWLRHAVWVSTSNHRHSRSAPATAVTFVLGFVAVMLALPASLADDLLAWLLFLVFLGAGAGFTMAANRPIHRAFGANGLRLMRYMLDHMTGLTEEGRREMEGFFDSLAEPAEVRTAALAFRASQGTRGAIVVTHAHPGPFGRIGGSDMPTKLRTALGDVAPAVLVPHGPSTHDYNPATTAECLRIAGTAREILEAAKPVPGGSAFARATVGAATATAQLFGDVALVTASLAPRPTDDIDVPTGHAAVRAAKDAGARDCLFVDAHNCAAISEGLVHFGSEESLQVIEATHRAVQDARLRPATSLRVGFAAGSLGAPAEGMGAQGLQVFVAEADGRRAAYLLFDGNNMVPGLRDEILSSVREVVEDGEVLTTDNHSVNATMGGFNPVGGRFDRAAIVALGRETVERAVADLKPAEAAGGSGVVHGLRIFGHENTARLTSSVNATIAILRPTAILTMGFAVAVAVVLLVIVP